MVFDPLNLVGLAADSSVPAVVTREGSFDRTELRGRAAAVAAELERIGAAGRRAIISLDASPEFVAALAGAWLAGAEPVLLDPLVRGELRRAAEITEARVVIHGGGARLADLPDGIEELVPGDGRRDPGFAPRLEESQPVVRLFTSGSTGKPTLVPKTRGNLETEIEFLADLLGEPRRVATMVPWCHIFGFTVSFLLALWRGGSCDLRAGISLRTLLAIAVAGELDLVVAVPAIYRALVRAAESADETRVPSHCRFVTASAHLSADLRERFAELTGRSIVDIYGSTEAGGMAYRTQDGPWTAEPHVEWRIADGAHLEVSSPSVSVVPAGGFFRVGDLARRSGDGFELIGREDDVVKIGGRRVSIGEVERTLESCPGVEAQVVLRRRLRGEPRLVAVVAAKSDGLDGEEVKAFVRSRLADHKVPRVVRVLDSLPIGPGGKVDRRAVGRMLDEEV
ncbi:MAG: class I adenylate-forming enzyme family protein [Polyangia bacterium]